MKFFCSQCRSEREVKEYEEFKSKHNLRMAKTVCPVCGLELFRRLDTDYRIENKDDKKV